MFYRGSFVLRLFAALVLLGLLAGAGYLAYRTGFDQGYVQGVAISGGETLPDRPGYPGNMPGYWPGYWRPHFGFFPFFPFFGFFLVGLLIFWAVGALFRPRHWGYPGYWHRHSHEMGAQPWGPPPWEKDRPSGEPGTEGQAPASKPETGQS
jgi:hypothetical protein